MFSHDLDLDHLLEKAEHEEKLSTTELQYLLELERPEQLERIFKLACTLRNRYFGKKVFLYSFIYFSTYCRNNCAFCYYRRSNLHPRRYRKTETEVLEAARSMAASGVHLIDLTMGEDPFYYQRNGFDPLVDLVKKIKDATALPVMISPGVVPGDLFDELAGAGADWYACYQETYNQALFRRLRTEQSYALRFSSKEKAMESGLLVEDGLLAGVGESLSDIALSLEIMSRLGAHQVRVMSFVPQKGTPLSGRPAPPLARELKIIALLRLLMPYRLIPASLDIDGVTGLEARLGAGANVITSLIPPQLGYAGVAQSSRDIDDGYRTVPGVIPTLKRMNLEVAALEEYQSWIAGEKKKMRDRFGKAGIS